MRLKMRILGISLGVSLLFAGGCINLPKNINVNVDGDGDSYRKKYAGPYEQPRRTDSPGRDGTFFYGLDVMTPPNRIVELVTRVRTSSQNAPLSGIKIQYFSRGDSRIIGTDVTDRNGYARLRAQIGKLGDYEFEARVASADHKELLTLPKAQILVACRNAAIPVVVVDLDRTLVQSNRARIILLDGGKPMRGSVDVMNRVARKYSVIYLTDRLEDLSGANRNLLARRGFPKGVVVLASGSSDKEARLTVISKDFPTIQYGIASKLSVINSFCRTGIRKPVWMLDYDRDDPDEMRETADKIRKCRNRQVVVVQSWEEIDRAIFGRYNTSPKSFADRLDDHADYIEEKNKDDDDDDD